MEPHTIRFLRIRRGLNQYNLSVLVGCSQAHISGLENGRTKPDEQIRRRLRDALEGVPVEIDD